MRHRTEEAAEDSAREEKVLSQANFANFSQLDGLKFLKEEI